MITLSDGTGGTPPSAAPRRWRRGRPVLLAVLCVLVLAVVIVAAVLFVNDKGDSNDPRGSAGALGGKVVQAASTSFTVGPTRPDLIKDAAPMTITQAGTELTNVRVKGTITVDASNVTIRNFVAGNVIQGPKAKGLVLENGTLNSDGSPANADGAIVYNDYTARNLEISHSFDGVKALGNVTIDNCWIHDLNAQSGNPSDGAGGYTHNDGVQSSAGSHITIRNSRIERPGNNSAVFIDSDQGTINDVHIVGNFLDGGTFTLYVVQSRSAPQYGSPTNVVVEGNVFGNDHQAGPVTLAPGVTFRDNTDLTGQPIPNHVDNLSE